AGSSGETSKLAFAVRLVPIAVTEEPGASAASPLVPTGPETPARTLAAAGQPPLASPAPSDQAVTAPTVVYEAAADPKQDNPGQDNRGQDNLSQEARGPGSEHSRKADEPRPVTDEAPQYLPGKLIPHTAYSPDPIVDSTSGHPASPSTAEPVRQKEAPELTPGSDFAKAPGTARDIRLEVGGEGHRSEERRVGK